MGTNRQGVIRAVIVTLVVAFLLLGTGGYLVWNVVNQVSALDGAKATSPAVVFGLEKKVREFVKFFESDKKQTGTPAVPLSPSGAKPPAAAGMRAEVKQVRVFESGKIMPPIKERVYSNQFSRQQARYINTEISYTNNNFQVEDVEIPCIVQYYNAAGKMLGEVSKTARPKKEWSTANFSTGWGWETAGLWPTGQYTIKVIFDGKDVGTCQFTIE